MDRETRIRRLKMRSWRRGMKEMDLILGPFADAHAAGLEDSLLARYEALLEENDQDLYAWILARMHGRPVDITLDLQVILDLIVADAGTRLRQVDRI